MTGQQENLSGSRDSGGPGNSRLLPEAKPRVICFQARLNPESQMDFSVGRGISHYLFYYIIMSTVNKIAIHKIIEQIFLKIHSN